MDLSNRKVVMFATHGLVPGDLNGLTQPALALTDPGIAAVDAAIVADISELRSVCTASISEPFCADTALGSAGLMTHEPPGVRCSDDVQVDQVAKQFPDTGTLVQKGREVRFDLSNSSCTVNVPSVRGKNADVAAQQLTDLKIRYRTIYTPVSDAGQDGVVQDQNIEGTNTKPFVVVLSVGQFDQPVTSPTSSP